LIAYCRSTARLDRKKRSSRRSLYCPKRAFLHDVKRAIGKTFHDFSQNVQSDGTNAECEIDSKAGRVARGSAPQNRTIEMLTFLQQFGVRQHLKIKTFSRIVSFCIAKNSQASDVGRHQNFIQTCSHPLQERASRRLEAHTRLTCTGFPRVSVSSVRRSSKPLFNIPFRLIVQRTKSA